MAMPENELPSEEQLDELPIEALRIYASRCALRMLPFIVGGGQFNYLKYNKEASVATLSTAAMIGLSFRSAADVADVASVVVSDIAVAPSDAYASYAADIVVYAADADAAYATYAANAANGFGTDALEIELSIDFNELKQGLEIQSKELWRVSELPPEITEILVRWSNALGKLGLGDYVDVYKKLLNGYPSPDRIITSLIYRWRHKYKPKLESIESEIASNRKKEAVKSPKLKKDKEEPEQPPFIDLRGHLSIKSELASDEDHLGRDRLVKALAELLTHKDQKDPLTIGLLGDWGGGKTTVLKLLKKRLKETKTPNYSVQIFNAWSYEHTENIQAGVAQEAILGLTKNKIGFREKLKLSWQLNEKLNKEKLYGYSIFLFIWIIFIIYLTIFGRLETILKVGVGFSLSLLFFYNALKSVFSHSFTKAFAGFLKLPDYTSHVGQLPVYQKQVEALSELCLGEDERLLFIVDDLDRCSPDGIVKVFEAIRLVMEIKKVTVIIAIDHRIALSALAHQYKNLADDAIDNGGNNTECRSKYDIARDYLGKIIQLPVNLGRPDQETVDGYVAYLFKETMHVEAKPDDLGDNEKPEEPNQREPDSGSSKEPPSANESSSGDDNIPPETPIETLTKAEPNKTMLHSLAEKTRFSELTDALDLHNPRQLKRLYSSYRLLRAYANREEAQNLKIMTMLFWLEQKHSRSVNQSNYQEDELEAIIIELSDYRESKITNETLEILAQHFDDKAEYLSYKKLVKPFVLPQARQ